MKANSIKSISFALALILLCGLGSIIKSVRAQDPFASQSNQTGQVPASQSTPTAKEYLGPTADSIRPYRPSNRDPFKKTLKPKAGKVAKAPRPVGFPTLDVRRAEFRQKVELARNANMSEPDPISQYLVAELEITGIFRDERGFGAFVRAQPTGTMFFVRHGARCYNGEVLRIESDDSESGTAKVLFREVSYLDVNGKQAPQERIVAKLPTAPATKK